jgi:hypothetical protein
MIMGSGPLSFLVFRGTALRGPSRNRLSPAPQSLSFPVSALLAALLAAGIGLAPTPLHAQSAPVAPATASPENHAASHQEAQTVFREKIVPFVNTYCTDCHGNKKQKGGMTFRNALRNPGDSAFRKLWKQSAASLKAHDMPPEDAPKQPAAEERAVFLDWVTKTKFLSPKDPGEFVIRRLNKVEYANTLHDLLGTDPRIAQELPDEVFGAGYLNTLSPLLMEQLVGIANQVVQRALPSGDAPPSPLEIRLFGPSLGNPAEANPAHREATRRSFHALARSAYRRPATEAEVDALLAVYDLGIRNGRPHRESLRLVLKAILVSPQFLFITPAVDPAPDQPIVPVDDHQLAARLSYLLWATMPDTELSALADAGKLRNPAVLSAQTRRMLGDARARALFDGFGAQWLGLGKLAEKTFDSKKFPQMTPSLREAMVEEGRLFFESVVRENRSVVSFVDSNYTFLNSTLAPLYGLEKEVTGSEFRRVPLTNPNRGGILGMPGILATTSFPNRTSPVNRGVWVLEQVLGEHVPPAPANVPALDKQDKAKVANLTLRQRTELHRTNPVCANCHKILDPIGFGLENFDAIGRWRDSDENGGPIDAAGELPGEKRFSSPQELKKILAARSEDLTRNLTERLLAYALGRQLEGYDEIVVDQMTATLTQEGHRMQTLITQVVTSYPFTHRRIHPLPAPQNSPPAKNDKKVAH